jgi:glycine dehydrogenase
MLEAVGASSLDALMDEVVPADIRLAAPLALAPAESEAAFLRRLRGIAARNTPSRSYIGMGYHDTVTPAVVQRNVFENPGWYTPYTPYQAEIAQGRLESLLNFQTMVSDLCGMEVANASLLDEATAAAEAMALIRRVHRGTSAGTFLVTVRFVDLDSTEVSEDVFGVYAQSPDDRGEIHDLRPLVARAHAVGALVAVGTDLLALTIVAPPGEAGADVVVGNAQRFGVPLGYGGPHAAFFAAREKFVRQVPGRLIGVSKDTKGRPAYRMALQTREQHIRREKATSNICTAQALLANMAAFYGVFHGPEGLHAIAARVHDQAARLASTLEDLGWDRPAAPFFDTVRLTGTEEQVRSVRAAAEGRAINYRYPAPGVVQIALDETVTEDDLRDVVATFAESAGREAALAAPGEGEAIPEALARTSDFMTHTVFSAHRSETEMMRYIRELERKDIGLDSSMIPLGSCTLISDHWHSLRTETRSTELQCSVLLEAEVP